MGGATSSWFPSLAEDLKQKGCTPRDNPWRSLEYERSYCPRPLFSSNGMVCACDPCYSFGSRKEVMRDSENGRGGQENIAIRSGSW